ncbi:hypothetical protein V5279_03700 [Bradyrhizobium sp. 26S5]|uniref:hypothetical protein n=1 Tax=Bradyrhizobium sp. 26S5 TaxID=3139729 RepID=UPI0030D00FFA
MAKKYRNATIVGGLLYLVIFFCLDHLPSVFFESQTALGRLIIYTIIAPVLSLDNLMGTLYQPCIFHFSGFCAIGALVAAVLPYLLLFLVGGAFGVFVQLILDRIRTAFL